MREQTPNAKNPYSEEVSPLYNPYSSAAENSAAKQPTSEHYMDPVEEDYLGERHRNTEPQKERQLRLNKALTVDHSRLS